MRPLRGPPNRINGSDPGSVTDAAVAGISSEIVRTVDRLVKARTPPEMRNRPNKLFHVRFIKPKAVPF